jgi:hypothetical protein
MRGVSSCTSSILVFVDPLLAAELGALRALVGVETVGDCDAPGDRLSETRRELRVA